MHPLLQHIERATPDTVLIGSMIGSAEPDDGRADFVVGPDAVLALHHDSVTAQLPDDPSDTIVQITGDDAAAILAGQVLAIAAGVRAIVATDLVSARRAAVMITQVLEVPA